MKVWAYTPLTYRFQFLWILQPFCNWSLPEAACSCECRVLRIKCHCYTTLLIPFLFPFQACCKCTAHCMT